MKGSAAALFFAGLANAGTVLWSGSFDYYSTSSDFDKWSWSNQVPEYQWYIHGSSATSAYLNPSSSYGHPGVAGETNGLKLSLDQTSHWNGQTMLRTEIIPQVIPANGNPLGSGHLYYHFSLKRSNTNAPLSNYEHQVVFFESHFTELKYGVSPNPSQLQWCIGGQPKYGINFDADVWLNFAYDIDFSAGTVGLWHSRGNDPLVRVANQQSASPSTNSADWHVGVLNFNQGNFKEDWYFSGVYVESGSLTTGLRSGGTGGVVVTPSSVAPPRTSSSAAPPRSSSSVYMPPQTTSRPPVSSSRPVSSPPPPPSSTPTNCAAKWGQCGGQGWAGATCCQSGSTCKVSNQWYSQCL